LRLAVEEDEGLAPLRPGKLHGVGGLAVYGCVVIEVTVH